jgi:hypothetical protein
VKISVFGFRVSNKLKQRLSLFVAGGTTGGSAAAAGGTCSTLKLPSYGKGKGRHHALNFLALTFRAGNLFGCIQY